MCSVFSVAIYLSLVYPEKGYVTDNVLNDKYDKDLTSNFKVRGSRFDQRSATVSEEYFKCGVCKSQSILGKRNKIVLRVP